MLFLGTDLKLDGEISRKLADYYLERLICDPGKYDKVKLGDKTVGKFSLTWNYHLCYHIKCAIVVTYTHCQAVDRL